MTEEQRREPYYIARWLKQLERWRCEVATKQGALDEETRLRLERKIDGEQAALHKRLEFMRRVRALPVNWIAARHAVGSASATETPTPKTSAATALGSKARALSDPSASGAVASDLLAGDSGQSRQKAQKGHRAGATIHVQRRSKRRTGRRRMLPITVAAAVLFIVVAGYFGSRQLDRQAEVFLDSQLTEMIEESGARRADELRSRRGKLVARPSTVLRGGVHLCPPALAVGGR